MGGALAHVRVERNAHKILFGNAEGERPLRKHSCKWKSNVNIDLKEVRLVGVDWIREPCDNDRW